MSSTDYMSSSTTPFDPHSNQPLISTTIDYGSDAEIITGLQTFEPVTKSERNVWAFWDKGFSNAPPWNQRNVVSWVRRLGPSWTVRLLDRVEGSPVHVDKFIDSSFFPEAIREQTMEGPHPLLYLYGGIWRDVGFYLFKSLDDICWKALEDPASPFEMAGFKVTLNAEISNMFNGFIAARKGNPCIKHRHEIFVKVWEGATNTLGMHKHPLLRHLPKYEPPSRPGMAPPFMYAQFVDCIAQVFCLERLRNLQDPGAGWNGPEYFARRVLLFDCVKEVYWAQRLTIWDGRKQFNLLATRRTGGAPSAADGDGAAAARYKVAEALINGILATSATMKLSDGLPNPGREYLAEIWDRPEYHDADVAPRTFATYLRWASEHFESSSRLERVVMPMIEKAVLVGGMMDVLGDPPN
ncbi:hypothetical protein MMC31_006771 [Peltigera leucophlebia]|nr:hypothetical protein [Peltigera leucophlebia]